MTDKLLAYHLKSPRVPLVVRVPQFENHWVKPTKLSSAIRRRGLVMCLQFEDGCTTASYVVATICTRTKTDCAGRAQ